jgi:hypothetical protein
MRVGYAYVRDPQFDHGSFAVVGGEMMWRRLRAEADAWIAADDDNQRGRIEAGYRVAGVGAGASPTDGSYLEVGAAGMYHRYGSDAFLVWAGEIFGEARCDLVRVGPSLDGAFVELLAGVQLERIRYAEVSASDYNTQLLVRAGFGLYLGRPGGRHGELQAYYDHRRDDLIGGFAEAVGFVGHFGLSGFFQLTRDWGLNGSLEAGSANIARISLVRRYFGGVTR